MRNEFIICLLIFVISNAILGAQLESKFSGKDFRDAYKTVRGVNTPPKSSLHTKDANDRKDTHQIDLTKYGRDFKKKENIGGRICKASCLLSSKS
jgi:hypothetical protein